MTARSFIRVDKIRLNFFPAFFFGITMEETLFQQIPLSKSMGIKILSQNSEKVELFIPLQGNSNHKNTAFGGSLYCGAVLSCWLLINEVIPHAEVVIAESTMKYTAPVMGDFTALCFPEDRKELYQNQ